MRITASSLDRVARCPLSATLPQAPDRPSHWGERGTALHNFVERAAEVGREAALAEVPEQWKRDADALHDHTVDDSGVYEIAMAFDPATGTARELGRGQGRNYGDAKPTDITGTADFVAITEDDRVFVRDLKTGRGWQPEPAEHYQLRFYALAAALVFGKSGAIVELCRDLGDGGLETTVHHMDFFDLQAFAAHVRSVVEAVSEPGHEPRPGPWCKYCKAFEACPSKLSLAKALAKPDEPPFSVVIDEHTFADVWQKVKAAKDVIKRIETGLEAYVDMVGSVPLADGAIVQSVEKRRESIVADVVDRFFADDAFSKVRDIAVEKTPKASKASIKRALKELKKLDELDGSIAENEREMLGYLRQNDGVKVSTWRSVEETKPKGATDTG